MSTGETENYGLPQYQSTDHPDFLDEINKAYAKLDSLIADISASLVTIKQKEAQYEARIVALEQAWKG